MANNTASASKENFQQRMIRYFNSGRDFVLQDIWRMQMRTQKKSRTGFLVHQLRIFLLAIRGFTEDSIQLRASALTLYSLLSVVPVVAMVFGIAKGFGFDDKLREEIVQNFEGQQVVMQYIMDFADKFLGSYQGGFMAGVGLIVLFYTVMKVLGNIESSFNFIWQIKKPRPWARRFSDYLSLMLVAPILILLSSSLTVFITSQVQDLSKNITLLEYLGPFIYFLLQFVPYMIIWALFTLIYAVMPNTKVNLKYALIAGIIAGTMFQLLQWGYINGQVLLSRYNVVYGSFAALPLFLIWLQISWLIVLFGAEISFAYQNVENYEFENESLNITLHHKRILTFLVAYKIIRAFADGHPPYSASRLSHELEIPIRLVRDILYELMEGKVIIEVATENPKENNYQPARDINSITFEYLIEQLEHRGSDTLTVAEMPELEKVKKQQEEFLLAVKNVGRNKLVKDL